MELLWYTLPFSVQYTVRSTLSAGFAVVVDTGTFFFVVTAFAVVSGICNLVVEAVVSAVVMTSFDGNGSATAIVTASGSSVITMLCRAVDFSCSVLIDKYSLGVTRCFVVMVSVDSTGSPFVMPAENALNEATAIAPIAIELNLLFLANKSPAF